MTFTPIPCLWDGESFTPTTQYWAKRADERFVVGVAYPMDEANIRSRKSHDHFFAVVKDAWLNLPDEVTDRFANPDSLRYHALIHTGYRDERTIVAASKAEALRMAAFMRPASDQVIVIVRGPVIVEWTAKSQSYKAMGKVEFQKSKDAVLDYLASMVGVKTEDLAENARKVA